jgi:hypothetical protein
MLSVMHWIHIGPPLPDFRYIVERKGAPVHYFVSNIYLPKVITNINY